MSGQGNSHFDKPQPEQPLVIIADDDPSLRLILHHILAKEKFRVMEATNGNEALKLCTQHQPELVILDAVMPELDGFTACRIIKEESPALPVLIITSLDDDSSVEQAYRYGADDYITKPINWSVLKHRVAKTLRPSSTAISRFEECIINNQYDLFFIPRVNFNNEKTSALEAQIITHLDSTRQLSPESSRNSVSTPTLIKILNRIFNDFKEIDTGKESGIRLTIPLVMDWSHIDQYTEVLKTTAQSCEFNLHQLEIIIQENHVHERSVQQLLDSLNQLQVKIILGATGLSLNTLYHLNKLQCYAIDLDINTIKTALTQIQLQVLQQLLAPYQQRGMKLFVSDIQQPEDSRLALELGCIEGKYTESRTHHN